MHTENKTIIPTHLKKGDALALIAPAGRVSDEILKKAVQNIEQLGFEPIVGEHVLKNRGYLSATDELRLDDLHKSFENPKIKGIVCIRGGFGTTRILSEINYELIRQNPKFFMGFSDITALLQAITKKTGLITFHGSVAASDFTEYSKKSFMKAMCIGKENWSIQSLKSEGTQFVIHPGKTTGRLVGGNLSLLCALIGTEYDLDWTGKIVFIEDVGEAPYRIDRMLTQLLLCGKLQKVSGLVFGNFSGCDFNGKDITSENSFSLRDVIIERTKSLKVPTVYGFSFGHVADRAVFPVGAEISFDADNFLIQTKIPTMNF